MRKVVLAKIVERVDDTIVVVRDAMHEDALPAWRGEKIVDALLDARHAATELRPQEVPA